MSPPGRPKGEYRRAQPEGTPVSAEAVREQALVFDCEGDALLGILTDPASTPTPDVGVVIVVGGPQVRAGSHRQFVKLARAMAAGGHPVLRFDVRGMGDSSGPMRNFEGIGADIGAAVDALMAARPALRGVVLWGLCDGASAALLYLDARPDQRVLGLALVNPWVRSEASQARTQVRHYYLQRLRQPGFWRKLLRGGVALGAWRELGSALARTLGRPATTSPAAPARYQDRMATAANHFDGPMLLVLSGNDHTAREFESFARGHPAWTRALARPALSRVDIADADHTFSQPRAREALHASTLHWLVHAGAGHG